MNMVWQFSTMFSSALQTLPCHFSIIIDELEPTRRGIYSGAAGYISFQDDMDTAIVLRTAVLKDGVLYAQAGGGIVHDSSPDGEWQETRNKLRAVLRAAEMVQQGLDDED